MNAGKLGMQQNPYSGENSPISLFPGGQSSTREK